MNASIPAIAPPLALLVDGFSCPIGIDSERPQLRWRLPVEGSIMESAAWQVLVSDSAEKLKANEGNLWDSGRVAEERTNAVRYAGGRLGSRQRCWWKVRVWDAEGNVSSWSDVAWWEMGLLQEDDWQAEWIGSDRMGGPRTLAAAPFIRRSFEVNRPVRSARLYVTALGLLECELNGRAVGDAVLAPGWTDYRKRVHYQAYDVTEELVPGENVLGAILGDGWYCGHIGNYDRRQTYGDRPKFLGQLEVNFEDGSSLILSSDASWSLSEGPILENDILMGEVYDARRELKGWASPGYDASVWRPVTVFEEQEVRRVASPAPAIRRIDELDPISANGYGIHGKTADNVYDFGQNLVGRVRLRVEAPAGTTLRIRHAEVLNPDGSIYTDNLRDARAENVYTCRGGGVEVWEPRFTFHGFRYVEIKGRPADVQLDLTAVVLHSDMAITGHFECSNPLLNQLQSNILWGQKGNFLDVPTDCPQRDERLGWTGDAQVFVRTACFNMDVEGFFRKWFRDLRDAQFPSGGIPAVVPNPNLNDKDWDAGPAWSDAQIICPWTVYRCFGDKTLLEEHYPSMQAYLDRLVDLSKDLIRVHTDVDSWGGFGDWLALDGTKNWSGSTRKDLIGTAFLAHDAGLMSRIAAVLGKEDDVRQYDELREQVKAAFQRRFVTEDGLLASSTQTAYILALEFGLLPDATRLVAGRELARLVQNNGNHISTGFVGTPYICDALERTGQLDLAYKLLEQESFPSWLFPVTLGATTIWERWDGWTPEKGFQSKGMNSFNHYAYGAVGAWMYRTVAGIELDEKEPAYRRILFRPRPGGSLTWAEAMLDTPNGKASIRWERLTSLLEVQLTVPPNSRATLSLPDGTTQDYGPGYHTMTAPFAE